jgi:hypothetical protein
MSVARQIVDASKSTLNSLENQLAGVFKPVPPRKEFVNTLGNQIQTIHQPAIIQRLTNTHYVLILLAGILSIGTLLIIGARAIFSLVNVHRKVLRRS